MFKAGNASTITYLGKGTRIIGDVYGTDTLVCEGQIRGTIEVDGLVQIGTAGKVEGRLRARAAEITGVVQGDIATQQRLRLQAACRVKADVVAPKLVIEAGAVLDGKSECRPRTRKQRRTLRLAPSPQRPCLCDTSARRSAS